MSASSRPTVARPTIVRVEWARLQGQRPRHAGRNARLDEHGSIVRPALARLTTSDGAQGFGFCRAPVAAAQAIVGQALDTLFQTEPGAQAGATAAGQAFDFPLWDLMAKRADKPVYALATELTKGHTTPAELTVPCYDTSLYIDDLHLEDEANAAALIAAEAREGWARGHRAFKLKVGRGSRHMDLMAGTRRDIAVIQAVRAAIGPHAPLMIDANNGYNLNLTKQVLTATADCAIYWLEEAFHEDSVLYADLRAWLQTTGLDVLIADGEGDASPQLLSWAETGVIDVVQYDIFGYGFSPWLRLGQQLDAWNVRSAPHHYGAHYGNYAACHLASAIQGFSFVEWDEATTPGLDAADYRIVEGRVQVPNRPGFGVDLDEDVFVAARDGEGYLLE
ncbi:MAG: enolase C-terminal domain-like protein [Litorilinea sp.]